MAVLTPDSNFPAQGAILPFDVDGAAFDLSNSTARPSAGLRLQVFSHTQGTSRPSDTENWSSKISGIVAIGWRAADLTDDVIPVIDRGTQAEGTVHCAGGSTEKGWIYVWSAHNGLHTGSTTSDFQNKVLTDLNTTGYIDPNRGYWSMPAPQTSLDDVLSTGEAKLGRERLTHKSFKFIDNSIDLNDTIVIPGVQDWCWQPQSATENNIGFKWATAADRDTGTLTAFVGAAESNKTGVLHVWTAY